jgi:quercetin dioxygenase-like cupin family protein
VPASAVDIATPQHIAQFRTERESPMNDSTQNGLGPLMEGCGAVDLAGYQDGSIVSRILMKKKAGTVTMFAFDKGQILSEHTTPYDALVQLLDGQAEFTVGGKPHVIAAGDIILLPANIAHAVKALDRFKMVLTMIRSE